MTLRARRPLALAVLAFAVLFGRAARAQEPGPAADAGADAGVAPPVAAPGDGGVMTPMEPEPPLPTEPKAPLVPEGPRLCPPEDASSAAEHVVGPAATGDPIGGFVLRGDWVKSDNEAMLHAVLEQLLPAGAAYGPEREVCLVALLLKLQYSVQGPIRATRKDGKRWLAIQVHPATLVRSVNIDADFGFWRNLLAPILDDDISVRLRIREGFAVLEDERARKTQLDEEAQRLADWFAKQGFFEARVSIDGEPGADEFELKLRVKVVAGARYRLGQVRLTGNTSIPDDELLPLLAQRWLFGLAQARFSKDELNRDLAKVKRYYQSRGFPEVRVRSDFNISTSPDRKTKTVNITVMITEKTKIDVAYEGNDWAGSDELDEQLTLDAAGSADDEEVSNSADTLRGWYQGQGFFQAIVTWERARLLPTFERVLFSIVEGPRWRVAQVDFAGNVELSDDKLRAQVQTRPYASLFSDGGYVTTVQLDQDEQAIRDEYHRQGFASAQVTARVSPHPALLDNAGAAAATTTSHQLTSKLYVRFDVVEGPRDIVGIVEFIGNARLTDRDLERATKLRPGGPFSTAAMENDRDLLHDLYISRGLAYSDVSTRFALVEPGLYRVTHMIIEGEQVKVGKVVVRGNFVTEAWVIRDVLDLEEGDVLTRAALRNGRDALQNTGLFSSVRIDALGVTDEQRYPIVHPLVAIQERYDNWGDLEIRGGYSEEAEFFAGGGYGIRNLGGVGASLTLNGLVGYNGFQAAEGNARLPWWVMRRGLRLPLDLSVQAFFRNEIDARFGELQKYGYSAVLSRQLSGGLAVSFRYNYVHKEIDDELVRGAGMSEDSSTTKVTSSTSSVGASVVLDRRRDSNSRLTPISPIKGFKLTTSVEYATSVLGGEEDFLKFSGSGVLLTPISTDTKDDPYWSRFLVTNGLRYDHGVPLAGGVLLPETERFVAGGDLTIRGFEQDRAYTEIIKNPLPPGTGVEAFSVRAAGGNIRAIHNLDLQVRICDCLFGQPLASAVFLDTGVVMNSFYGFVPSKLRHSLGIALVRVVTPVVSASFEYAVPLDPQIGDDNTGRFHINFGFVVN